MSCDVLTSTLHTQLNIRFGFPSFFCFLSLLSLRSLWHIYLMATCDLSVSIYADRPSPCHVCQPVCPSVHPSIRPSIRISLYISCLICIWSFTFTLSYLFWIPSVLGWWYPFKRSSDKIFSYFLPMSLCCQDTHSQSARVKCACFPSYFN